MVKLPWPSSVICTDWVVCWLLNCCYLLHRTSFTSGVHYSSSGIIGLALDYLLASFILGIIVGCSWTVENNLGCWFVAVLLLCICWCCDYCTLLNWSLSFFLSFPYQVHNWYHQCNWEFEHECKREDLQIVFYVYMNCYIKCHKIVTFSFV